ncbi:MAG: hypothetical protein GC164_07965 [Phycisphaera sp.]|nr:hypothetical protein [Phycisphaera sp.]
MKRRNAHQDDHAPSDHAHDVTIGDPAATRQVVIVKRDHRYIFRYTPGQEQTLIDDFTRLVEDPDNDLDWFDAAMLSHQVGQSMNQQLARLLQRHTGLKPTG